MSVFAVVRLNAHPGKGRAIRDMLNGGLPEVARGDEGVIKLELFVSDDDPDKIVVLEELTSIEAHTRYVDSMGDSFDSLMELVAERTSHHYGAID